MFWPILCLCVCVSVCGRTCVCHHLHVCASVCMCACMCAYTVLCLHVYVCMWLVACVRRVSTLVSVSFRELCACLLLFPDLSSLIHGDSWGPHPSPPPLSPLCPSCLQVSHQHFLIPLPVTCALPLFSIPRDHSQPPFPQRLCFLPRHVHFLDCRRLYGVCLSFQLLEPSLF